VFALTELAPVFGARLSGLIATYPLFGAVLAAFAHHLSGAAAAGRVLRGLLIGLFGFTGFFLLLALTIERVGIAAAFAAATVLALAIQGGSLWALRRLPPGRHAPSTMKARPFELARRIGNAFWYSGELYQRRTAAASANSM